MTYLLEDIRYFVRGHTFCACVLGDIQEPFSYGISGMLVPYPSNDVAVNIIGWWPSESFTARDPITASPNCHGLLDLNH